jgi:hypothetical protein
MASSSLPQTLYLHAAADTRELAALQKLAEALLAMGSTVLDRSVTAGELTEICHKKRRLLSEVRETAHGLITVGAVDHSRR